MSKSHVYDHLKPLLGKYTEKLFKGLVDCDLLVKSDKQGDSYRLSSRAVNTGLLTEESRKSVFSELFELRNIARNVYTNLYPALITQNPLFSECLIKLEESQAISLAWERKTEILETLDKLELLVNDEGVPDRLKKMLDDNNIGINRLIYDLLEFYGREKASRFFGKLNYQIQKRESGRANGPDLELSGKSYYYSPLIFEFKIRRRQAGPDTQMILSALKMIKDLTTKINPRPYIFLVVFTPENFQSFEGLKFQFRENIHNMPEFKEYNKQITFVPVSFSGLHLIDYSFEEFNDQYLKNNLRFNFRAQTPPADFPDRNDHFIETVFDIRLTEFIIDINPVNSEFWRLGFRFAKDYKFPPINSGRHGNPEIADIHISVGDIIDTDKNIWGGPRQLVLTDYHAPVIENSLGSMQDYDGRPVTLTVTSNHDASDVLFSIRANGKEQGIRRYNLQEFNSCKIFAWADHLPFHLETEIKMIHKGK